MTMPRHRKPGGAESRAADLAVLSVFFVGLGLLAGWKAAAIVTVVMAVIGWAANTKGKA
jgi:hypothetical protein